MNLKNTLLSTTLVAGLLGFGLVGCEKSDDTKTAGEKVDSTMDKTGDKMSSGMDKAGDKMGEATDKTKAAMKDMKDSANDKMDGMKTPSTMPSTMPAMK